MGLYTLGEAVTLQASSRFMSPGVLGAPLDAAADVVSTGRTVFVRGVIERGDARMAASLEGPVSRGSSGGSPPRDVSSSAKVTQKEHEHE